MVSTYCSFDSALRFLAFSRATLRIGPRWLGRQLCASHLPTYREHSRDRWTLDVVRLVASKQFLTISFPDEVWPFQDISEHSVGVVRSSPGIIGENGRSWWGPREEPGNIPAPPRCGRRRERLSYGTRRERLSYETRRSRWE